MKKLSQAASLMAKEAGKLKNANKGFGKLGANERSEAGRRGYAARVAKQQARIDEAYQQGFKDGQNAAQPAP